MSSDMLNDAPVAGEQPRMTEVNWDYFMDFLLPPLRERIDIKVTMNSLKSSGHIGTCNGELHWATVADDEQSSGQHVEDHHAIAILANIASASARLAHYNGTESPQIRGSPTVALKPGSGGQPYALFTFDCADHTTESNAATPIRWHDIAIPAGHMGDDDSESQHESATSLLSLLGRIMREDARRRFVFGLSIEEGFQLRVWYASRSHILASSPIDFLAEAELVAELFLRLMWADARDLGMDSTIRLTGSSDLAGGLQYDIEVSGKMYRTQRLISSIGAHTIQGRGTRVWEVRELDENGEEFGPSLVLKDAWVDHGLLREPELLRQVRASARSQADADVFARHLLHVAHSGDVLARNGEPDDTHTVIYGGGISAPKAYSIIKKDIEDDATLKTKSPLKRALAIEHSLQEKLTACPRRVHYRTVFEEVGITILEVKVLQHAFWALKDVVTVLGVMHACGWVHRDVSTGNVLIHDNYGKLADLEFAKRDTDTTTHDARTGTEPFMAVEVKQGYYKSSFIRSNISDSGKLAVSGDDSTRVVEDDGGYPAAKRPRLGARDSDSEDAEPYAACSASPDRIPGANSPPISVGYSSMQPYLMPFRHNPLHDLESVLWLSWYLLASTKLPQFENLPGCDWGTLLLNRAHLSAQLFNSDTFRWKTMSFDSPALYTEITKLHPVLEAVFWQLDPLRIALGKAYRDAEYTAGEKAIERMTKHQAARAQGEASPEDQPPAIPFSVAWDKNLYAAFHRVFGKIVSEREPRYLYLNGKLIWFQPRTTLLAERIREMENLQEQVETERLARSAALAVPRSNGNIPEAPEAPRTLKRSVRD